MSSRGQQRRQVSNIWGGSSKKSSRDKRGADGTYDIAYYRRKAARAAQAAAVNHPSYGNGTHHGDGGGGSSVHSGDRTDQRKAKYSTNKRKVGFRGWGVVWAGARFGGGVNGGWCFLIWNVC